MPFRSEVSHFVMMCYSTLIKPIYVTHNYMRPVMGDEKKQLHSIMLNYLNYLLHVICKRFLVNSSFKCIKYASYLKSPMYNLKYSSPALMKNSMHRDHELWNIIELHSMMASLLPPSDGALQ